MRKIIVDPYNKKWIQEFEKEKILLIDYLQLEDILIHHIGSTSVKGLAAKPIIDILLEIENVETLDRHADVFTSLGYECKGEFGIDGRRYFQKGGNNRTHQIHAFKKGSMAAKRHIAFRDYLIEHTSIANEYESLKYKAAKECNNDISIYCDIKHDFVVRHEKLALKWSGLNA